MSALEPIIIDTPEKPNKSEQISSNQENFKNINEIIPNNQNITLSFNKIYISSDEDIELNEQVDIKNSNLASLSPIFTKIKTQNNKDDILHKTKKKCHNVCINISSSSNDDDSDESDEFPSLEKLIYSKFESKETYNPSSERLIYDGPSTSKCFQKENNYGIMNIDDDINLQAINDKREEKVAESENEEITKKSKSKVKSKLKTIEILDNNSEVQNDRNEKQKNRKKNPKIEQKKFEKEQQKLLKEIEKEIKSYSKPGMALKIISMEIDNQIEELRNAANLWSLLQDSGIKYTLQDNIIKSSILWYRDVIDCRISDEGKVSRIVEKVCEEHLLIIFTASQLIDIITEMKQLSSVNCNNRLISLSSYEDIYPDKNITYLAFGVEKYFRELKNKQNRNFRARVRGQESEVVESQSFLSFADVEEFMVCLQIQKNTSIHLIESIGDLGSFLISFSKAIAEAPYKKEKNNDFSWYADGDTNKAVKVTDIPSLLQVWQQQIDQFALVSKEVAEAIVVNYPSPQLLLQAYKKCNSKKEAEMLLKGIQVSSLILNFKRVFKNNNFKHCLLYLIFHKLLLFLFSINC